MLNLVLFICNLTFFFLNANKQINHGFIIISRSPPTSPEAAVAVFVAHFTANPAEAGGNVNKAKMSKYFMSANPQKTLKCILLQQLFANVCLSKGMLHKFIIMDTTMLNFSYFEGLYLVQCLCVAGRSYSVFSQRMLNQCLESLVQKIQSGVVINFEKTGPDPPPLEGEKRLHLIEGELKITEISCAASV